MAGKVYIPLLSLFDDTGVKKAIDSIGQLGASITGLKGLAGGFSAASIGKFAFSFIGDAVDQAKALQGQMMALDTVFGANNKGIHAFIANSEKLALSHDQAAQAATFLGTNLKSAGLPMAEVTKKTEKLLKLSTDLAITYGHPVEEALTATAAMFRGEYDPIEKFGVAIKQSQVNAVLAAAGLNKLKGQALLNASTIARFNLLITHSKDAQGALERQSNTLVVKQQKLGVAFADQQAILGLKLLPILTDVATKFLHMAQSIAPALESAFQNIASVISNLFQGFQAIQPLLALFGALLSGLIAIAGKFAVSISKNVVQFAAFAAGLLALRKLATVFLTIRAYWDEFGLAVVAGSTKIQAAAVKTGEAFKFIGAQIKEALVRNWVTALIAIGFELVPLIQETVTANTEMQHFIDLANQVDAIKHPGFKGFGQGAGAAAATARAKDINKLATQLAAINAREKGQAASEDAAYKARLEKYKLHIHNVWVMKKAAWDAQIAANKAEADANAKAAAQAAAQLAKDTASMRSNLKKLGSVFSPTVMKTNMGAVEQAVVTSFGKIVTFLSDAINNGTLTKAAANAFKGYAAMEAKALRAIASQRDKVQNKLDLARTLIGDTKKAVLDFANITNTLQNTSNEVTQSVSYIAGQFQVLLSSTNGADGAGKILSNLKDMVDKTKEFGKNLKSLAKMGLNTDLYNQILQAGVDSGGATAAALVAGGKSSVDALNSTFADLSNAATDLGTTAAEVMYGQGVDLTNGLIDGLLSQDKALKSAAETLATAFSTAFNSTLNRTLGSGATKVNFDKINTSGLASGTAKQLLTNVGAASSGATVNVTVNAGMGADGVAIGAQIVKAVRTYEKTNGKVFSK